MSMFIACKQDNASTEPTEAEATTEVKTDAEPMADTTATDTMINETKPVSRPN
ncbi:MAG TPA: hypothetical protein PLR22_02605 [Saprospiraceae bacterium]|nr:hypothetical protein [Saprospiraceae bacterium]